MTKKKPRIASKSALAGSGFPQKVYFDDTGAWSIDERCGSDGMYETGCNFVGGDIGKCFAEYQLVRIVKCTDVKEHPKATFETEIE